MSVSVSLSGAIIESQNYLSTYFVTLNSDQNISGTKTLEGNLIFKDTNNSGNTGTYSLSNISLNDFSNNATLNASNGLSLNSTSNSVVLNWTTSSPTTGVISFSRDMQFNNKMTDSKLTTNHSFIIKALSESMKYFYKIIEKYYHSHENR